MHVLAEHMCMCEECVLNEVIRVCRAYSLSQPFWCNWVSGELEQPVSSALVPSEI